MSPSRKSPLSDAARLPAGLGQHVALLLLVAAAIGLLLLTLIRPQVTEDMRTRSTDMLAPALAAVSQPVSALSNIISTLGNLTDLRAENERLREENERLRTYQTAVMQLEAENKGLRDLLKMPVVPEHREVVAKVIADAGGPFSRNVIALAGAQDGVRNGLTALAAGGVAGRVISTGRNSSRILLINDLNARVPVLIERTRQRGMVAGDTSAGLRLTDLPEGATLKEGDRLLTSGVGGIYPPGLPVGVVRETDRGVVRVEPIADLTRLEILQILDPGTPTDLLAPESTQTLPPALRSQGGAR
jgi:rod shape-determining protein MreC